MRIELTTGFTTLSVTEGTFQNVSRIVPIEIATSATEGTGIVLNPGEIVPVKSEATIYARSAWENPNPTEKVLLAHEPFKRIGGGGDYTLPTMTETKKGGAKLGNGLYTQNDHLNLNYMGTRTLGGAMVGAGLHTDSGALNLNMMSPSVFGGAKVGAGLHTDDGALTLNMMGESLLGGAKLGAGLYTQDGALNLATMGESVKGGAMLGSGLYTQDGKLNLRQMSDSVIGGAKLGGSLAIVTDRLEVLMYRKPSTAYAVGDIAFIKVSAKKLQKIVCVQAGTTASGDFALPSGYGEGSIHNDGTVVWAVDSYAVPAQFSPTGTAIRNNKSRNTSFRFGTITDYYKSGLMSENIRNGCYLNIYIGDQIFETTNIPEISYESGGQTIVAFAGLNITNATYRVIGLRPFHDSRVVGDVKDHIVINLMLPSITKFRFNSTITTTGAMAGSELYQHTLPALGDVFKSIFGANHILKHKRWLTNAMNDSIPSACYSGVNGAETGWIKTEIEVGVPTLSMLGLPHASSLFGNADYFSELSIVPAEYIAWTGVSIGGNSKLITVDDNNGIHFHNDPTNPMSIGPYFLYA